MQSPLPCQPRRSRCGLPRTDRQPPAPGQTAEAPAHEPPDASVPALCSTPQTTGHTTGSQCERAHVCVPCREGHRRQGRQDSLTVWAQGPSGSHSHGHGCLRAAAEGLADQFRVGHGHRHPTAARRPRGRSCPPLPAQLFQNPPDCSSTWGPLHTPPCTICCVKTIPAASPSVGPGRKPFQGLNALATRLTGHGARREGRAGSRATGTDPVWPRLPWTPGGLVSVLGLAPREGRGATATGTRPQPARASAPPQGAAAHRRAPSGSGPPHVKGIKQEHTIWKEVLVRAPQLPPTSSRH